MTEKELLEIKKMFLSTDTDVVEARNSWPEFAVRVIGECLRLREALKFYANEANFKERVRDHCSIPSVIWYDSGEKARIALGMEGK